MANGQSEAVLNVSQVVVDAGTVAGVSDGQLLARFNAHRDELAEIAFTALVRRHGPMVLRVCRQVLGDWHTADDAFQATFLILARRAGSIHRPELLGHWLYGVASRTARTAKVRNERRRRRESSGADRHERWNRSTTCSDPNCHWSLARSSRPCTRRCPDCPNGIASPSCSASWRV